MIKFMIAGEHPLEINKGFEDNSVTWAFPVFPGVPRCSRNAGNAGCSRVPRVLYRNAGTAALHHPGKITNERAS
jgi:hypothetical protein